MMQHDCEYAFKNQLSATIHVLSDVHVRELEIEIEHIVFF